jgi:hypothetical protein
MRAIFSGAVAAGLLMLGGHAADAVQPKPDYSAACKTSWNAMAAADKAKTNYGDYLKTCMENGPSAAPPASTRPVVPTQMSGPEKKQACESKWLAQQKITPTGSQDEATFMANCMSAK